MYVVFRMGMVRKCVEMYNVRNVVGRVIIFIYKIFCFLWVFIVFDDVIGLVFYFFFCIFCRFYWGYVYCEVEGLVCIDEGFFILVEDFVCEFMRKKGDLFCYLFGD